MWNSLFKYCWLQLMAGCEITRLLANVCTLVNTLNKQTTVLVAEDVFTRIFFFDICICFDFHCTYFLGPLLLTWFNFNLIMDK